VALPHPGSILVVVLNQRQGLRIEDNDVVLVQLAADGILVDDVLVMALFQVCQVDGPALQGVVHFLGDADEVARPLSKWLPTPPCPTHTPGCHAQPKCNDST